MLKPSKLGPAEGVDGYAIIAMKEPTAFVNTCMNVSACVCAYTPQLKTLEVTITYMGKNTYYLSM